MTIAMWIVGYIVIGIAVALSVYLFDCKYYGSSKRPTESEFNTLCGIMITWPITAPLAAFFAVRRVVTGGVK